MEILLKAGADVNVGAVVRLQVAMLAELDARSMRLHVLLS
jgi:hypothetical protein